MKTQLIAFASALLLTLAACSGEGGGDATSSAADDTQTSASALAEEPDAAGTGEKSESADATESEAAAETDSAESADAEVPDAATLIDEAEEAMVELESAEIVSETSVDDAESDDRDATIDATMQVTYEPLAVKGDVSTDDDQMGGESNAQIYAWDDAGESHYAMKLGEQAWVQQDTTTGMGQTTYSSLELAVKVNFDTARALTNPQITEEGGVYVLTGETADPSGQVAGTTTYRIDAETKRVLRVDSEQTISMGESEQTISVTSKYGKFDEVGPIEVPDEVKSAPVQ